jgi:hypothetical protein
MNTTESGGPPPLGLVHPASVETNDWLLYQARHLMQLPTDPVSVEAVTGSYDPLQAA